MVLPLVVLSLLDLMAVTQIRDRDAAIKAFKDDLELLFVGPFTVFHNGVAPVGCELLSLSKELKFYTIWTLTKRGAV